MLLISKFNSFAGYGASTMETWNLKRNSRKIVWWGFVPGVGGMKVQQSWKITFMIYVRRKCIWSNKSWVGLHIKNIQNIFYYFCDNLKIANSCQKTKKCKYITTRVKKELNLIYFFLDFIMTFFSCSYSQNSAEKQIWRNPN